MHLNALFIFEGVLSAIYVFDSFGLGIMGGSFNGIGFPELTGIYIFAALELMADVWIGSKIIGWLKRKDRFQLHNRL